MVIYCKNDLDNKCYDKDGHCTSCQFHGEVESLEALIKMCEDKVKKEDKK